MGKSEVYGKYKVNLKDEQETENFTLRRFQISEDSPYMAPVRNLRCVTFFLFFKSGAICSEQGSPDAVVVTLIHHTKWPKKNAVPSTTSVLQMINILIKVQIKTGNHAIIVMCK